MASYVVNPAGVERAAYDLLQRLDARAGIG
jgi:hypothetical protein